MDKQELARRQVGKQKGHYTVRTVGDGRKAGAKSIIFNSKNLPRIKELLAAKLGQTGNKPTWDNIKDKIKEELDEEYGIGLLRVQAVNFAALELMKRTDVAKKFDSMKFYAKRLKQTAEIVDFTHIAAKKQHDIGEKFGMHTTEGRSWNYAFINISKAERDYLVSAGLLENHAFDKLAINVKGGKGGDGIVMNQIQNAIQLAEKVGSRKEDERLLAKRKKERETKLTIMKAKKQDVRIKEDYDGRIVD